MSCCFQPGGPRCLGCMSQHESNLQPHRDAFSLPEIQLSQTLSDLRNSWPRPKNLVTKDGYGSPGEMGASLGSSKLVKEKHELEAWRFLCSFSLQCLHLQNGDQLSPWFGFPQKQTLGERFELRYFYFIRGDCRKHK